MAHLALSLLGSFQATLDGRPAEGLNSETLRALLAYLAVEGRREHSREQLASLLWPERSDREALNALRYALSNLHGALGDRTSPTPFLLVTRSHVEFNSASDHWLDLTEFQGLSSRSGISDLEQAAALYRGPFLEGLSLRDSPAFEEWMLLKGEEIQRSLLALLDRLTSLQLSAGNTSQAAGWARKQLELEPYREQAHRQLMRALALGGERSAALTHYEACRRLLAEELGCEPEDETQALYAQIRDGSLPISLSIPPILAESPGPVSPAAGVGPASPFVARQEELAKLGELLDQALAGHGGVVLISGEAGSGKTALLDVFSQKAGLAHPGLIALRGRCSAYGGAGDPYLPFREMLQTLAGDIESKRAGGTLSLEQAQRVWEALPTVGAALAKHGPDLIDRLISGEALLRRLESFSSPTSTARWQKKLREIVLRSPESTSTSQTDLFAQVTQVLHTLSLRFPLILATDDLQWADSGTVALLFHLGRRLAGSRILLGCAFRPLESSAGQGSQAAGLDIETVLRELRRECGDVLVDLEQADGRAFVEAYIDNEPNYLGTDFRQTLYNHTGGNPLFTVELLRSFQCQGMLVQDEAGRWIEATGLDWTYCPPRVEAVIAGHLAGLPEEDLELLQAAAVQGEQFAAEVAARVLGRSEDAVLQRLSGPLRRQHRLVEAVSLERLNSNGQCLSHYRFRHALLQRGAYGSLDGIRRPQLHEATGTVLEAFYTAAGEKPQALAPALAWHYEEAGLSLRAARSLYEAGCQAMRLSAYREALHLCDHGLALLENEPPSSERQEIKRLLEVARLAPQRNLDGMSGAKFEEALARAKQAWAGDARGRPLFQMLAAEAEDLSARGQYEAALAVATRMHDEAMQRGEEDFLALAHWRMGAIQSALGNIHEGERYFEWLLAWLTAENWARLRSLAGHDFTAACLAFSAINQWFLGYPETALRRATEAMNGAVERGEMYGQAFAFGYGAAVLFLSRVDEATMESRVEYLHRLSLEQGFEAWKMFVDVFMGRLTALGGDCDCLAGVQRMQAAIAAWRGAGLVPDTDIITTVLADTCLTAAGRLGLIFQATGEDLLAAGLEGIGAMLGPENVPCGYHWVAELHRLRGEMLHLRDGTAAAEEALASFQTALGLAREHGFPAIELRAAMSLVRLRARQGEAYAAELAEARVCLRDVYAHFSEGFSFPDLQEAIALLSPETV